MAGKVIGFVAYLEGTAETKDANGVVKLLSMGDPVHDGDLLITGNSTEIYIDFINGEKLQVSADTEVLLDETVHRIVAFGDSEVAADILALQQAILEGVDLSELEATAAGQEQLGLFKEAGARVHRVRFGRGFT